MGDTSPPPKDDILDALRAALGAQYSVERLLGRGGMGSVYLGHDRTLDRPVAIKVINPEVASNQTLRNRFLQEARTVARLRHPSIVPVFAAGEAGDLLYFVMEFVEGESLRDLLTRESKLPEDRAVRILREVALALDHAHAQGLVHRDVKPENILIERQSGRAMLTDFGVARALENDGSLTQTGMIVGSPRYMSPEQASGEREIDGRSDLYALALVAYEMFTGAPVVQSATAAGMLVKHLTETPPPLADRSDEVDVGVAAAIDRGLAKDRNERWATGAEFAAALGGEAQPAAAHAHTGTRPRPRAGARPARRISTTRIAVFAVGAVALAAAIWASAGRGERDSAYLVAPFEIQSGEQSIAWLREGSVNMLTLTLAQWTDLNVVDYERTLSLLDAEQLGEKPRLSLDDAMRVARRARAGVVVTGQVQTTRDSLLITARLYDVRSGKVETQAQEGDALEADPRPLFDRLAQRLLDIQGGRTSTVQLAAATTSNLEAYRAFLDGVRLLNSWRLPEADREFARAIALDSTFALAYHKRSLGLGWSEADSPMYVESADRAFELASRLPPRERALVEGHYHLTHALIENTGGDTAQARERYARAIAAYRGLIEKGDSLVAEAWYGLADAYFHARSTPQPVPTLLAYMTASLRGFHRTIAIDSSYHLAYSHLVQLYSVGASGSGVVIVGDSVVAVAGPADVARLGGADAVQRIRDAGTARGIEIASAWARADADSPQPYIQLAQNYINAGRSDSAIRVLSNALARPTLPGPAIRTMLVAIQVAAGDTGVATTLKTVLDRYTADSMRTVAIGQRFGVNGMLIAAAGMLGSSREVDRATALFAATDPTLPFSPRPTQPVLDVSRHAIRVAMGEPVSQEARASFLGLVRQADTATGPARNEMRQGAASIPYLAYLATRDTSYSEALKRWGRAELTELDALAALERGDTATAERIAATFPSPDSLRNPNIRFGLGGMRTVARAEVLAALGRTRLAAEMYDAYAPDRFNQGSLVEPGYAVWVRSFLDRARLWREVGDRDRAIAGYEEFLQRWRHADGPAARLVAEARRELADLRDAPPRR